ncbi:ABC transporter ATP-binding protein [Pantoea sp. B65]|uniref:ABC transporter ATP-binding protein n=1 Tax=Pantoea sp. B65 TaxID=2813359 RepID=UPI0039B6847C
MLELQQITKRFGATTVLNAVDLQVAAGSRTAIVGPSGSGKTTLLRIIAGFEMPQQGRITLQGARLVDQQLQLPAHQRGIGFVPQDGALFPHFTVAGNIAFGVSGSKREKLRRVEELMEMVALDRRLAALWPHELSGGQQQRVALARALAQRPVLMLLDEPFSALDTGLRAATRKAVGSLLTDAGIASILVTHDQNEALSFADQIAVIRDGRLTQVGTPRRLYTQPVDEATAHFLGDALIFPARVEDGWAACALGRIAVDSDDFSGDARVMLRPEQLQIAVAATRAHGCAQAEVTDIDFAGFISRVTLRLSADNRIIEMKTLSQPGLQRGITVTLAVKGKAHLFAG